MLCGSHFFQDVTALQQSSSTMSVPSSSLLSAHRDVLEASIPESSEAKGRLVEELMNRGRGAVVAKAWRDAELLYRRAIDILQQTSNSNNNNNNNTMVAVLYANLSLVQFSMNNYEEARTSAHQATIQDPTYLKGFWRLGQALAKLGQTTQALEAMETAMQLEPDNKALSKEVAKLKLKVKEEDDLMNIHMDMDSMPSATTPTTTTTTKAAKTPIKTTTTTTKTTTSTTTTTSPIQTITTTTKEELENHEDDDTDKNNIFTKSDHIKGYKVVNGKKTSYFHRELSEAETKLIGDIAPKRLEQETSTTMSSTRSSTILQQEQEATTAGRSAWNTAGTWEEHDVTTWAKDTLTESLLTTCFVLPPGTTTTAAGTAEEDFTNTVVVVKVSSIPKCDGHASFATVRGKKRYIYEFSITLEWTVWAENDKNDNDNKVLAKGRMTFPDVDGTCELGQGYEMMDYQVDSTTMTTLSLSVLKPMMDQNVQRGGFREAIHECLDHWVRLFRATY